MSALVLYLGFAVGTLALAARTLRPIGRWTLLALIAVPLPWTAPALVGRELLAPMDLAWNSEPWAAERARLGVEIRSPGIFTDVFSQMIPWRAAVRTALAAGEWPLWNPYAGCGEPLAAMAQPALWHPIRWLELALPLPAAPGFAAAAALLIAALAAFLAARELAASEGASLVAAIAWSHSGFLLFWLSWPQALAAAPAPLALVAAYRVARDPRRSAGATLVAALTLSILGGHPEVTFVLGLASALCFLGALVGVGRERAPVARRRALVVAGVAAMTAVALTAVAWLPFADALEQSAELALRRARAAPVAEPWPIVARRLLLHVVPHALGVPGDEEVGPPMHARPASGFAGSIALALALVGGWRSAPRTRLAIGGGLAIAALAAARAPGLATFAAAVPVLAWTLPEYLSLVVAVAVALGAARGVDALLGDPRRRGLAPTLALAAIAYGLVLVALSPGFMADGLSRRFLERAGLVAWAPIALAAALAWATRRSARLQVVAIAMLLLVGRRIEMDELRPAAPLGAWPAAPVALLEALRAASSVADAAPERAVGVGYALVPNLSTLLGVEDPRTYNALRLARFAELAPLWSTALPAWFQRVDDLDRPILDLMNVRRAIVPASAPLAPGWRRLKTSAGSALVENLDALPRAFLPTEVVLAGGGPERSRFLASTRDFAAIAWIETGDPPTVGPLAGSVPNGSGTVSARRAGTGLRLRTELASPAWIVVSTSAWRGWRAHLDDGTRLEIGVADGAFLALAAPAGLHAIDLRFAPPSFALGLGITIATVVALALAQAGFRRRSRRPRSPAASGVAL